MFRVILTSLLIASLATCPMRCSGHQLDCRSEHPCAAGQEASRVDSTSLTSTSLTSTSLTPTAIDSSCGCCSGNPTPSQPTHDPLPEDCDCQDCACEGGLLSTFESPTHQQDDTPFDIVLADSHVIASTQSLRCRGYQTSSSPPISPGRNVRIAHQSLLN